MNNMNMFPKTNPIQENIQARPSPQKSKKRGDDSFSFGDYSDDFEVIDFDEEVSPKKPPKEKRK